MTIAVPIETAKQNLEDLPERLRLGETITLISSEGTPVAILVSLKPVPTAPQSVSNWEARWDALSQKVTRACKSDKSAVEILTEMRRSTVP